MTPPTNTSTMTTKKLEDDNFDSMPSTAPSNNVLFPAVTWDYTLTAAGVKYGGGFGLVAARNIRMGEKVFDDSLKYTFVDVNDEGDFVHLDRHEEASRISKTVVPPKFPLTSDVLLRTHGVPRLDKDTMTAYWQLEVPGMFMNHSCNPSVDYAEDRAAYNIKKGDELTVDYALEFYDHGPLFEKCECGATSCRGSMMGFKALSDEDKERLFPLACDYVQARHLADTGRGPPIKTVQKTFARAPLAEPTVPRLVFLGHWGDVVVKQDEETGQFGLYSLKEFTFGEKVYEFWCQTWPADIPNVVDMVLANPENDADPPEGTVVRIDASQCATRDRTGRYMFSGGDLLTKHSCDPNLAYKEDEDENWQYAHAARDIKVGDQLTIDLNCMLWDRSESLEDKCDCGFAKCTGTRKGFKFLSREAQEERKLMSWRRVAPPYEDEEEKVTPGEALSPHVRVEWRKADSKFALDSDSTDSSSFESESSFESDFSDCT